MTRGNTLRGLGIMVVVMCWFVVLANATQGKDEILITSFEEEDVLRKVGFHQGAVGEIVSTFASDGKYGLKVEFKPEQDWPGFSLSQEILGFPEDWSRFNTILFDVYNPGEKDVSFGIRIDDPILIKGALAYRQATFAVPAKSKEKTVVFCVDENLYHPALFKLRRDYYNLPKDSLIPVWIERPIAEKLDMTQIKRIQIFISMRHVPRQNYILYFDNFRLISVSYKPAVEIIVKKTEKETLRLPVAKVKSTKTGRTFYTDKDISEARRKVATEDWARGYLEGLKREVSWALKISLEELWNYVPPARQLRAINVAYDHEICPECNVNLFTLGGMYPWLTSRDLPFKVQCRNCKAIFPDNEFIPWFHGGREGKVPESERAKFKYYDDGLGWVSPKGVRYAFVAYHIYWRRWHDIIHGIRSLAEVYVLTDEIEYARSAAVLLARIATIYPDLDYTRQAQHSCLGFPPRRYAVGYDGRIEVKSRACLREYIFFPMAYDWIYPALDDPVLKEFLKSKGVENVRDLIELNLISTMVEDCIASDEDRPTRGIFQHALCVQAIVLDNKDPARGWTTKEIIDWVLKDGPGPLEYMLYNTFYREGMGADPAPNYMALFVEYNYRAADLLTRLSIDLWKNPRLKKIGECFIDLIVADNFVANIGDAGNILGEKLGQTWFTPKLREHVLDIAFRRYGIPKFAQALHLLGGPRESVWKKSITKDVREIVNRYGIDLGLKSRNLGGFKLAILKSGKGRNERGISLYYGTGQAHGHADRLNIELFAFGKSMLPDMGYPSNWLERYRYWVHNTVSHYCVVVDETKQTTLYGGELNLFAGTPSVQLADADANKVAYPGIASLYRRQTVLIDHSPEQFYVFDVFRVKGGRQHDWSFHGPPFIDFKTEGSELTVQKKGTVAGEDIEFGKGTLPSGFQWLRNVHRGKPADNWSATWSNPKENLHIRMIMPKGFVQEVIVADGEVEPIHTGVDTRTLRFILGRNKKINDEELFSTYPAIIEPYRSKPSIVKVTRLTTKDGSEGSVSVMVTHSDGTEDIIYSSLHNDRVEVRLPSGKKLEVAAKFAMCSIHPSYGLKRAVLVDGTELTTSEFSVKSRPSYKGEVIEVDFEKNTVTVNIPLPQNGALNDRVIIFRNALHSESYTIKGVKRKGRYSIIELGDIIPIVGAGKITKIDTYSRKIYTDTRFDEHHTVYSAQHQGRWLYNENKSAGSLIKRFDIRSRSFELEEVTEDLEEIYKDYNGDGRREFWVVDIAPGDTFYIPSVTYFDYLSENKYRLRIMTDVTIRIPISGDIVWYHGIDGKWRKRKNIKFSPDELKDGETVIFVRRQ